MHHAVPMCVVEGGGHFDGDAHGVRHRELLLAREAVAEGLALDEGHDIEEVGIGLTRVEQGEDVRVL